jgi:hypothetical protein
MQMESQTMPPHAGARRDPRSGRIPGERAAAVLLALGPAWNLVVIGTRLAQDGWDPWLASPFWLNLAAIAVFCGLCTGRRWARAAGAALGLLFAGVQALVAVEMLGWIVAEGGPLEYALQPTILAVVAAVALVRLIRGWRREPGFRESMGVPLAAFGVQSGLMLLVAVFGLGVMDAPWYQDLLMQSQSPGRILLTAMGYCCGLNSGIVFSDGIDAHWGGLTKIGIPILAVANTVGLLPLVFFARRLLRALSARRSAAREVVA